ncbi:MAG: IS200/IS605 family transposase [Deltaproteobacteria bacterium]|nr:IS200/IS605 family transposase [Deltaproteobacteria bacterium]
MEILEGNVKKNHVHLVLSFPPKYSVAEVVGSLKGKTAIRLHREFGARGMGKHFWSRCIHFGGQVNSNLSCKFFKILRGDNVYE